MSQENRTSLISKWVRGYRPTQQDYTNLFESVYLKQDDTVELVDLIRSSKQVVLPEWKDTLTNLPEIPVSFPSLVPETDENATIPVIQWNQIPSSIYKNLNIKSLTVTGDISNTGNISTKNISSTSINNTGDISTVTINNSDTINSKNVLCSTGITADTVSATTYQGEFTGNAWTASQLQTARSISISGDATYTTSFSGSADVTGELILTDVFIEGDGNYQYNSFVVNDKGLITTATSAEYMIPTSPTHSLQLVTRSGYGTTSNAITASNATDSSSLTTGALVLSAGGLAVKKSIYVGSNIVQTLSDGTVISSHGVTSCTVASTSLTNIDSFSTSYRSAKYIIQITQGTNYQVSELLVLHNGSNVKSTEYSVLSTSSAPLGAFSADISGSNVVIKVTMVSNTSCTIKSERTIITI